MFLVLLVLLVQEISVFSAENNVFSAENSVLSAENSALSAKIVLLVLGFSASSANSANKDDEFD